MPNEMSFDELKTKVDEMCLLEFKKGIENGYELLERMIGIIYPGYTHPIKLDGNSSQRDYLECLIESLVLYISIITKTDYKTADNYELSKEWKCLEYLVEYKMKHFGVEIFRELGLGIIEKTKDGIIVADLDEIPQYFS
ncbi:MAG: hypothetical protein ACRCZH_00270 [Cetobacterium sp.]